MTKKNKKRQKAHKTPEDALAESVLREEAESAHTEFSIPIEPGDIKPEKNTKKLKKSVMKKSCDVYKSNWSNSRNG